MKDFTEFIINNEWMKTEEKKLVRESLVEVCKQNSGEVVLYNVVTHIQDNIINVLDIKDKLIVDNEDILATIEDYNADIIRKEYNSSIHKCEICLSDLLGQRFEVLLPCSHSFCHTCLGQYCETHIKDGNSRTIDCPDPRCRNKVDISVIQKLVQTELFEQYDMKLLTVAIRSMSGSVWCPILDCQQPAQIISTEPNIGMMQYDNSSQTNLGSLLKMSSFIFDLAYNSIFPCSHGTLPICQINFLQ